MSIFNSPRPTVRYTSALANVVVDGNSLAAGTGSSGASGVVSKQLQMLSQINNAFTVQNIAVGGQTIANMRTRVPTAAAGAYVAGKSNVMIAWEGTNSICSDGLTGAAAGALMGSYCADLLAQHSDWIIILVTTIARENTGAVARATANAELINYDTYLKTNYRAMGAKRVTDLRQSGSIFILPDYLDATFEAAPYINYEAAGETTAHIHLNDLGYGVVAGYLNTDLARLPKR